MGSRRRDGWRAPGRRASATIVHHRWETAPGTRRTSRLAYERLFAEAAGEMYPAPNERIGLRPRRRRGRARARGQAGQGGDSFDRADSRAAHSGRVGRQAAGCPKGNLPGSVRGSTCGYPCGQDCSGTLSGRSGPIRAWRFKPTARSDVVWVGSGCGSPSRRIAPTLRGQVDGVTAPSLPRTAAPPRTPTRPKSRRTE